jgi:hypothetical protein
MTLVAEVLLGLLDETRHLPPDTLEHYSAFQALYSFCMKRLEVEIDMEEPEELPTPTPAVKISRQQHLKRIMPRL